MPKSWFDGLKYIAPQARKEVVLNWLKLLLRVVFLTPIFLIIAILHIPIVIICKLFFKAKLSDFETLVGIFNSFKSIDEYCFKSWNLSFKCSSCGEKVSYSLRQHDFELSEKGLRSKIELNSQWNEYEPKKKICFNCLREMKKNKDKK